MHINTIPHIIHYCWFGLQEKPQNIVRYINDWGKILPDYTFMEWNERNFVVDEAPLYVRQAYSVHKYAFVSDYVRVMVLSEYGGIYLDTDIEIIKRFDPILDGNELVVGFESDQSLETAFIACSKGNSIIQNFCKSYISRKFILEDGSYDMSVINQHFSNFMQEYGVDLNQEDFHIIEQNHIAIYPREYFAAFDINNWHISPTVNTYCIHHMNSSWTTSKKKMYFGTIRFIQKILGYKGYDKLKKVYDKVKRRK